MKYLHTMIRVTDPDATVAFFELIGLNEVRRFSSEQGRFTLIFLAAPGDEARALGLGGTETAVRALFGPTGRVRPDLEPIALRLGVPDRFDERREVEPGRGRRRHLVRRAGVRVRRRDGDLRGRS